MSGGFGRAALAGVALALAALLVGGFLMVLKVVELPDPAGPVTRVVVIAVAPDEGGGESAVLAYAWDLATGRIDILDTDRRASVAGTSARSPREAYPYGGGAAVAQALAPQTGGEALPWVVLPSDTWAATLDAHGGVKTNVAKGISVYIDGTLTVVEPGSRTIDGAEAVALASAAEYVEPTDRASLTVLLANALGEAVAASDRSIAELIASGEARSDLSPEQLPEGL